MNEAQANISVDDHQLHIALSGNLGINHLKRVWDQCLIAQAKHHDKAFTIDLSQANYCDEATMGLLIALKKKHPQNFQLQGMSEKTQALYELMAKQPKMPEARERNQNTVAQLGHFTIDIISELKLNTIFIGELCVNLCHMARRPKSMRWNDAFYITQQTGPNALGIVALMGFLLGLILAFQGAVALSYFGAQIYVANLVALSLFKEISPLMTAIILIGRSASAFAAEIGSMKVNQEIDALNTMGIEPIQFLAMPRIFAGMIMTPFLSVFMTAFGLIGCGLVMLGLGFSWHVYYQQILSAVTVMNFFTGIIKAFFFGIIISAIGCLYGMRARRDASGVGLSTTRAVVVSIVMVIIADGVFSIIYYAFGL